MMRWADKDGDGKVLFSFWLASWCISCHWHHFGQLLSPSYFIIKSPWYFIISCMNIFISLSLLRSYCVMDDTGVHLLPRSDVLWAIRRGYGGRILMTSMRPSWWWQRQCNEKLNNLNYKSFLGKNKPFTMIFPRLDFKSLLSWCLVLCRRLIEWMRRHKWKSF